MSDTFKILAIDGGGIRGILPAMMIAEIERRTGQPAANLFDLIAGSSTGGLLALALFTPDEQGNPHFSAEDLVLLYEREGPHIFSRTPWWAAQALNNITSPKYPTDGMVHALDMTFGELNLSDALGNVLITGYELQRRQPWFFRSHKARQSSTCDFKMRDVIRATTAAPTYFEPANVFHAEVEDPFTLIDGSMQANNPALAAWVEAQSKFPEAQEYLLISLGTGDTSHPITYQEARQWGLAGWAQHIMEITFDAMNSTVDYQLRHLMRPLPDGKPTYFRFQTRLDGASEEMDDATPRNIEALKKIGTHMLDSYDAQFDEIVERLLVLV